MSQTNQNQSNNNTEKSPEEIMKEFLSGSNDMNTLTGNNTTKQEMVQNTAQFTGSNNTTISAASYYTYEASTFPLGKFYRPGTRIMVRPCSVKEIQAYSTVNDNDFYDIVEKMNEMLSACCKVKYSDGSTNSYLDLRDGDRLYAVFLIRELTFQSGNMLSIDKQCSSCKKDNKINLHSHNMNFYSIPEDLLEYYDYTRGIFTFETVNGSVYNLGVPTIGLQKAFTDYIMEEYRNKKTLNSAFIKIVPFTISERTNITREGIEKHLKEFNNMDMNDFQFLNAAVNKMKFGIKELSQACEECSVEVSTDMEFPNGAASLFLVQNPFEQYLKK